jgi:hypothetical protein
MLPNDLTAEENLRLLQEIDANREFILLAYRSDPELLKRADPEIKRQFEPVHAPAGIADKTGIEGNRP